jgi:hypothetical protein
MEGTFRDLAVGADFFAAEDVRAFAGVRETILSIVTGSCRQHKKPGKCSTNPGAKWVIL